jgi:hypothetical protein
MDGCQECIGKECVCAYITSGCAAPAVMGMFHQWWLCNSGGCNRVVCGESGMRVQTYKECMCL